MKVSYGLVLDKVELKVKDYAKPYFQANEGPTVHNETMKVGKFMLNMTKQFPEGITEK